DESDMWRIDVVLRVEHLPADQRNAHGAEIPFACDAIQRVANLRRALSYAAPLVEIHRRLLAIKDQEISFRKVIALRYGNGASQPDSFRARDGSKASHDVV